MAVGADRQWVRGVAPDLRTSDSLALLRVIAEDTGGRAIEASWNSGLGAVFRRILAEVPGSATSCRLRPRASPPATGGTGWGSR